jgi:hypothetical protein
MDSDEGSSRKKKRRSKEYEQRKRLKRKGKNDNERRSATGIESRRNTDMRRSDKGLEARRDRDLRRSDQGLEARRDSDLRRTAQGLEARRDSDLRRTAQGLETRRDTNLRRTEIGHIAQNLKERNVTRETMISKYELAIKEGPTHVCVCCDCLYFKEGTKVLLLKDFLRICGEQIDNIYCVRKETETKTLCTTCYRDIVGGNVPRLCLNNGLWFPAIPEEL